jgi:hypothetical protein
MLNWLRWLPENASTYGADVDGSGGMTYSDPGCAYRPPTVRACRQGESDRVRGHNPAATLQLADTYYQRVWGPERPPPPPMKPVEERRPR